MSIDTLSKRGEALTLKDCACIGLKASEHWNGERIADELNVIFAKSGFPAAVLKDGGYDLKRGVSLWKESSSAKSIPCIDDIGHIVANGLKADFSELHGFKSFLKKLKSGASKLRQSELSFLTPPKIRTKGRFMGITKLARWAEKIKPLLGGKGAVPAGSIASRLRKMLGGFNAHSTFLRNFIASCATAEEFLKVAKDKGVNQKTYRKLNALVQSLPEASKLRKKLDQWLRRHIDIQCKLKMGQTSLIVSTDILESLFGKFKVMIARNPKAEFNRNLLAIPCLCGDFSLALISDALDKVTHNDLLKWTKENVGHTQNQSRHAFNKSLLTPDMVPKTGKAA